MLLNCVVCGAVCQLREVGGLALSCEVLSANLLGSCLEKHRRILDMKTYVASWRRALCARHELMPSPILQ
jgi:hypothetical protein